MLSQSYPLRTFGEVSLLDSWRDTQGNPSSIRLKAATCFKADEMPILKEQFLPNRRLAARLKVKGKGDKKERQKRKLRHSPNGGAFFLIRVFLSRKSNPAYTIAVEDEVRSAL